MTDEVEATEGAITVRVPGVSGKDRGPGTHGKDVFYNPAMAVNRDVAVLALDALHQPGWEVLEGLAASGVRGLRFAKQVPDAHVILNDWNPKAAERIEQNAKANGVTVEVTRRNLGALLWERSFHWIDIDPFGSPAPFLDAACRALRQRGVLALTATDSAALAGTYPRVTQRRYLATPIRCEFGAELGLRILAGAAVRAAAKYDRALTPAISHVTDYYYRVYLQNRQGRQRADEALRTIGHAWFCRICGDRGLRRQPQPACPACGNENVEVAGPLWMGDLGRPDLVRDMLARVDQQPLARPEETRRLLTALETEVDAPPLFYHIHSEVSRAGLHEVPRSDAVHEGLRAAGFQVAPTHMDPVGVHTDATAAELHRVLREVTPE